MRADSLSVGHWSRRSLIIAAAAALGAVPLVGCQPETAALTVYLLEQAVPTTLLKSFSRQFGNVRLENKSQASELFEQLQRLDKATGPTLLSLGDYWLEAAIQNQLISPLPVDTLSGWSRLPPAWQQLVTRNSEGDIADGQVWGAPYRTGSLVMAYRRAELVARGGPPQDWQDLWRDELAGKIAMLDSPRAVIGAVLKAMGEDPNRPDPDQVTALPERLTALHRQVKLYSSQAYLQPLILGDVWLAVGWSTDILPLVRRNSRLAVVAPSSGTLTTSDIWVQPASVNSSDGLSEPAAQWINFLWQPETAIRFSLLNAGVSPLLYSQPRGELPAGLQTDRALLADSTVIQGSEALLPLSAEATERYRTLWQQTR
ncbi:MAG: extracellular solute-binding protein [Cyanobacteria bacterium P01_A01_bin.135]